MDEVDRLSDLPECLILEILLKLNTKDVVKTSVLSTRWTSMWRYVPGLDLWSGNFLRSKEDSPDYNITNAFVSFVDKFLGFNTESCLRNLNLESCLSSYHLTPWINTAVKRKVQHLRVENGLFASDMYGDLEIPPAVYTCETLVSLILCEVTLPSPKFVSLPSLKDIYLDRVTMSEDFPFETFISECPLLENLTVWRTCDNLKAVRVCSKSLLRLTYFRSANFDDFLDQDLVFVVDAPLLVYLKLHDDRKTSVIINNLSSLVKVDINIPSEIDPNDLQKTNMIRNLIFGITSVKDMTISFDFLKVVYGYSRCEPLPLFRNLCFLCVKFSNYKMLSLGFLDSCPNLKFLFLESSTHLVKKPFILLSSPHSQCLKSSLEYVEIVTPLFSEAMEMILVSYFLKNSAILKKLTLHLDNRRNKEASDILIKKLHTIPRLSTSCQLVIL